MSVSMNNHGRRVGLLLVLFASALMLAACGGNKDLRSGETPVAQGGGQGGYGSQGLQGENVNVRGLKGIPEEDRAMFLDPNNPLSTRVIYFGFDSSAIAQRFAPVIQAHARYLAKHPQIHLRLEGHTDPRGTREYNIALGERRAESVQQALAVSGAGNDQITTLSFGEERPAMPGNSREARAKDRRVVLVYVR